MVWRNVFSSTVILWILVPSLVTASSYQFKHHSNAEILKVLETVHQACPNITRIYTLSETSVKGVPLYMIEFSTHPGQHEQCKWNHCWRN